MNLRLLYTLGLTLCMSNFASSNECARHCRDTGKKDNTVRLMPLPASASASSLTTGQAKTKTTSEDNGTAGEDKAYALTLIKLLYI